jgi:flagellar basal-body rod modification protein FlgD
MEVSSIAAGSTGLIPLVEGTKPLGQAEFLKLLMTQLQYQDPLRPVSNEAFVAQLAQFAALEQTAKVATGVQTLVQRGTERGLLDLVPLIGRPVTVHAENGDRQATVTGVQRQDGQPVLVLSDGRLISPSEVVAVS